MKKWDALTQPTITYGELWINEQVDPDNAFKPKFNSQEYDEESGFYFFNARYYDAEIGRFVTADSSIDGPGNALGWNRYAYCYGNPVIYKDPSGHFIWPTFSISGDHIEIGFSTAVGVGGGISYSWGNGGSVGVYASVGPEFLCFGASARVGVNYGLKSKESTGYVSASYGFRCGASVNASAGYNLSRGEFAGASIGVGYQTDGGANAGLSLNFNKNGYAGFSAGIGYTHTTANGSKIGGTVGGTRFDGLIFTHNLTSWKQTNIL